MPFDEIFVQRHAQTGALGDVHVAILRLHFFVRQFVAQRRVFDAIFKQEGIAAGAQPVNARRNRDRAGIAVVAQPRADLSTRPRMYAASVNPHRDKST